MLDMCHNARAFNITYSDTGLFGVYSVCEPMQCEDVSAATMDAWHRLSYSITDAELDIARNRLINQLLTELTSTYFTFIYSAIIYSALASRRNRIFKFLFLFVHKI